jgi:23S rRNA (adenine2503-C2)-methyltransferase
VAKEGRPGNGRRPLTDHDTESLARLLRSRTGRALDTARRAARKVLRHALELDCSVDRGWDPASLSRAGLGAWAHDALVDLDPGVGLVVAEQAVSGDGTARMLLRAHDGALVEAVLIPAEAGRDRARTTLCISSQAGCARACTFCETGALGLSRQLGAAEIVDQYRLARRVCASDRPLDRRGGRTPRLGMEEGDGGERRWGPVSNIVFMGMGEPFDNLDAVLRAVDLVAEGFGFPPRRITVSTVGVADKIETFFRATRAELAVSLNAPDDARRSAIMPVNRRFDMATLRAAIARWLPPGRRVLFQYALFAGFNDAPGDADAVAAWIGALPCRVNVIPANPGPDPALVAPVPERIDAFVGRLKSHGITTLVRAPRGRDVGGACGQLAGARRLIQVRARA